MFTDLTVKFPYNEIKSCCKCDGINLATDELVDDVIIYGGEYLKRKAEMLVQNRIPSNGCSGCSRNPDHSFFTTGNSWHDKFSPQKKIELLSADNFVNFEFVLSSACDINCLYCAPKDSTTWANVLKVPHYKTNSEWSTKALDLILAYLRNKKFTEKQYHFAFSGGEPTYNTETITLIEQIIDLVPGDKLRIAINTNGNTKESMLNRLQKCIERHNSTTWIINLSIDGVGKTAEAIRHGISWDRVITNLENYFKYNNVVVALSPTLNLYSLPTLPEFLEYFNDLFAKNGRQLYLNINKTLEDGMSIENMPGQFGCYIDDAISYCMQHMPHEKKFVSHLKNIKSKIETKCSLDVYRNLIYKFNFFKKMNPSLDWDRLFPHIQLIVDYYETNYNFQYGAGVPTYDAVHGLQVVHFK